MSEWKQNKLKDIGCSFLSGYAFKSSDYSTSGIPLIKIGNIQNTVVTIDNNGDFVSEKLLNNKTEKFLLNNYDVLIAMTGQGSVGRVGRLRTRSLGRPFLNQRVGKFICDEKNINIDYLYYILSSAKYQDLLFNTAVGSGQPNLSPELILDVEIPYTNYKEQVAIAQTLSSIDNKIDLLHRQNQTLEALAETIFRQKFIEEENNWEEKPLDTIAEFLNGLACQKYPVKKGETGLPVIKIKELKAGISDASDIATTDVPTKYLINDGDMLFSWSGSLDVAIWFGGKGVLNQHLFKVSSTVYPQWFYYYWVKFYLPVFRGVANDKATTMGHIQRHHLTDVSVLVPDDKTLKELDKVFSPYLQKIKNNSHQIKTLTNLRDTLLPKLMSREVTIK